MYPEILRRALRRGILCWLTLSGIANAADGSAAQPFALRAADSRPRVLAPGGYPRQAPPSTAPAIQLAIDDGLDAVELVVRRTKDGRHVVYHADRLEYCGPADRPVRDYTLAELQQLDAGKEFAPRFAGARLQTLAEVLALTGDSLGVVLVCQDVDPAQLARDLERAGAADRVLLAGANEVLDQVCAAMTRPVASVRPFSDAAAVEGRKQSAAGDWYVVPAEECTKEVIQQMHARQQGVIADCAGAHDKPDVWSRVTVAGVDIVRTALAEEFVVHSIRTRVKNRTVQFAAHRGALRYAPENTVPALEKAARMHNDFVEIDVQTTSDGALFLLHDATLDRTTDGRGRVRLNSAEVLRGLDAGTWFGRPFAGTRIPELEEYLQQFPPTMGLYFDAKDITPDELAAAVARHGLVERTVVYQGPVYLERLKKIDPRIRLLAPIAAASHVDTLARRLAPHAVDAPWKLLSREFIEHCHVLGIKVFSDAKRETTVDEYRQAIDWGIDLIQTDYPLRAWRGLEQSSAASSKP